MHKHVSSEILNQQLLISYSRHRNSHHVLHDLLPKETDSCYDFRHRRHNRLLINKTSHLADSDFIIRMIYKDMY